MKVGAGEVSARAHKAVLGNPVRRQVYGSPLSESSPVQAILETGPWDGDGHRQMHYSLELGLVTFGRLRVHYSSHQIKLQPGQMWFCGSWERHWREVLTPTFKSLRLMILPQMLLRARFQEAPQLDFMAPFRQPPSSRPQPTGRLRREVMGIVQRSEKALVEDNPCSRTMLRLMVLEVLTALLGEWSPRSVSHILVDDAHYEAVNRAIEMVLGNPTLTTSQAAKECGMSTGTFSRAFRMLIGISFAKFSLRNRLSEAATNLLTPKDTITEVARRWGFANASHFHRSFRQHYHLSPAQYRSRHASRA